MLVPSTIRRASRLTLQTTFHRTYSHGPTIGQVYGSYQQFDKHLGRLRPDLITDLRRLDALQASGELTPHMTSIFKKEVNDSNEAKSIKQSVPFVFYFM